MLFIGEADGGTFYQALDVSDAGNTVAPDSDSEAAVVAAFTNPSVIPFKWSFPSYTSFDHTIATALTPFGDLGAGATQIEKTVGHTWSDPAVGRIDVGTGSVHDSYDIGDAVGKDHFKNSLQADPTATGPVDSPFVDQVFIGDTEGSLWRFDTTASGGSASLAVPVQTYDAGDAHPFFASMAMLNVGGPVMYVFVATGMDIMPSPMKIQNLRMIGLKDDSSNAKGREIR